MSTPIDNGGPAFPCQPRDGQGFPCGEMMPGMTLRDWFAGMALQAILKSALEGRLSRISGDNPLGPKDYAVAAYANADAMLAARKEIPQ